MFQKFNLRTRTFMAYIAFVLFILITYLTHFFFATNLFAKRVLSINWIKLVFIEALPFDIILYSMFYLFCMFLLLKNTHKSKKIAWSLAFIPPLLILFNPLPTRSGFFSRGAFLYLFQILPAGDMITTLLILMGTIIPFLIIIYALSGLMEYENKKFDSILGIIFIVAFGLSLISKRVIIGGLDVYVFASGGLIFLFYTGFVFLRKRRKILLPISLGILFTFIAKAMTLDDFKLRGGFFLLATICYVIALTFSIYDIINYYKKNKNKRESNYHTPHPKHP